MRYPDNPDVGDIERKHGGLLSSFLKPTETFFIQWPWPRKLEKTNWRVLSSVFSRCCRPSVTSFSPTSTRCGRCCWWSCAPVLPTNTKMRDIPARVKSSEDVTTARVAVGSFQLGGVPLEGVAPEGNGAGLHRGRDEVVLTVLGHREAVLWTCSFLGRPQIPLRWNRLEDGRSSVKQTPTSWSLKLQTVCLEA